MKVLKTYYIWLIRWGGGEGLLNSFFLIFGQLTFLHCSSFTHTLISKRITGCGAGRLYGE